MARRSILGGESSHRGLLGSSASTQRKIALYVSPTIAIVLALISPTWGLAVGLAVVAASLMLTSATHNGSVLDRIDGNSRMRAAAKAGTIRFEPYSDEAWEAARTLYATDKAAGRRAAAALRQMPDGADGMGWLEMRRGKAGIQWHQPEGEEARLAVAFFVDGQIHGIEAEQALDQASRRWGKFAAAFGSHTSLARGIQSITRVLPPDDARHDKWVLDNHDPAASPEMGRSYKEVQNAVGAGAMVMRHYVVVSWPITPAMNQAAARRGEGRDGWRELMYAEVRSIQRRLKKAGMGKVYALTARQTAAVIRHMQDPNFPIDQAIDIDPTNFGVATDDMKRSAHVVRTRDPHTGAEARWWHATARINPEQVATQERSVLWTLPLLTGMPDALIRTLSLQMVIQPAAQAKRAARQDVVADAAKEIEDRKKGQVADLDTGVSLSAARRRQRDLTAGSGHHGAEWTGHITITAPTADDLAEAKRRITEVVDNGMGIEQLQWLDTYQPAASGNTWPIARGLRRQKLTLGDRLMARVAGTGAKDEL